MEELTAVCVVQVIDLSIYIWNYKKYIYFDGELSDEQT